MALDLRGVHKVIQRPDGVADKQTQRPLAKFVGGGEPKEVFVAQSGVFYSPGGQRIKDEDLPEWLMEQVKALDPRVREELKLGTGKKKVGRPRKEEIEGDAGL